MAQINFALSLDIDECATTIRAIGHEITPIIVCEPGCGKSTILQMLKEQMGEDEWDFIYVDCPVKDMMDVAASIPDHSTRTLEYYVSSLFKLGNGKKKVIMLDEFMKSPKLLQIIFTRLMLERMVGDAALPIGSIVFGTSNNTTDGVGDSMMAHAGNRVCIIPMKKPTQNKWGVWASKQVPPIARPVRAWAAMTSQAFQSYLDPDQESNPYIFKPSSTVKQFVSPRSLAKSSIIVKSKDIIGENAMMAALAGTIGEAAAKSMSAFIALEGKLMKFSDVMKEPKTCKVPDDVSALVMMMFEAVDNLTLQDEVNDYMDFVKRIPSSEVQSIFYTMMIRTKTKLARYNQAINKWSADNHMVL